VQKIFEQKVKTMFINQDATILSPDERFLHICGRGDRKSTLININSGKEAIINDLDRDITAAAFDSNGKFLYLAQSTNLEHDNIIMIDCNTCKRIKTFKFDRMTIQNMSFIPNTNLLFTCTDNGAIFLLDVNRSAVLWKRRTYPLLRPTVTVSGNGQIGAVIWDTGELGIMLLNLHDIGQF
jgi:WD40 repeat protein